MTRAEYADFKRDFIEGAQEKLLKKVSAAEKALYNKVLDRFIDKLDLAEGRITDGQKNLTLVAAIDQIFAEFRKAGFIDIIRQFTGDMTSITQKNAEYFRIIGEATNKIPAATEVANKRLRKQLGINSKGSINKGGFLDRFINDKKTVRTVKNVVLKGIAGKVALKDMQEDLKVTIVGTDKVNGELTRHLNTYLMDTYQQHDRVAAAEFAEVIGLPAFIYSGGKIASSRCFCEKNNGKVFTNDEADKWVKDLNEDCGPIWNEAKDGAYTSERMGGYGCRHSKDYITASEAIRRRPELRAVLGR
jgi:hypothetical protein